MQPVEAVILNPHAGVARPVVGMDAPANPPPRLYALAPEAALPLIRALAGHRLGPVAAAGDGETSPVLCILEGEEGELTVLGTLLRQVVPGLQLFPARALCRPRRAPLGEPLVVFLPLPDRLRRIATAARLVARLEQDRVPFRRLDLSVGGLFLEAPQTARAQVEQALAAALED